MKSFGFLFGLLILIIITLAGYYFYKETYVQTMVELQTRPISSVQTVATISGQPKVSSTSATPDNWKVFQSKRYGYSLNYPSDINLETTSEGDRFYKLGPTQSLGTELYDGISLTIRSGKLEGKTLRQFVDQQFTIMKDEITTNSITEIKPLTIGEFQGFKFRKSSLGEADFIYLQKSKDEYLEIIDGTVEPVNREQSFKETVFLILSSVSF